FSTLVIPWLTTPLLGKNSFVRFLPVATFIGYIFSFLSEIADRSKWWKVKNALFPNYRWIYVKIPDTKRLSFFCTTTIHGVFHIPIRLSK
ncbi:hypothetical protein MW695_22235, partial [Alkalihalobacillus sp. APA_J-10(15)]|nr:hypothetical protein [Halalkalibacter sp. APA_J-10(15)]